MSARTGTDYVDLVSGACLSDFGHDVCGNQGAAKSTPLELDDVPIYEPGFDRLREKDIAAPACKPATARA